MVDSMLFTICFLSFILPSISSKDVIREKINTCNQNTWGYIPAVHMPVKPYPSNVRPAHAIRRTMTRTKIECTANCLAHGDECKSVFFEKNSKTGPGTCHLVDALINSKTDMLKTGQVASITTFNEALDLVPDVVNPKQEEREDVCAARQCSKAGTCRKDCTNGEGVCVGDYADCSEWPVSNVQVSAWRNGNWGSDNAQPLLNVNYVKKHSWTGLKVQWRGNLRIYATNGCGEWWFTFNGQDCASGRISSRILTGVLTNYYKAGDFEGICSGIPKGTVTVGFNLYTCDGHNRDLYTGWHQSNFIIIEETNNNDDSIGLCPSLSSFNVKNYITDVYYTPNSGRVLTHIYKKRDPTTALRVAYTGNIASANATSCNMWYITFNGTQCSNPTKIDGLMGCLDAHCGEWLREGVTIDGLCYNLPAGEVEIGLSVGQTCDPSYPLSDIETGWGNKENFRVEEIRLGMDINAIALPNGTIYRIPEYNIQHWQWHSINNEADSGLIKEVTYNKHSKFSGLRVFVSYNARNLKHNHCNAWTIKFNSSSCTNPMDIQSPYYMAHTAEGKNVNIHRPMLLEGICKNLPAGTVTIRFEIGQCNTGHSIGDGLTGWQSMISMLVKEVYLGA